MEAGFVKTTPGQGDRRSEPRRSEPQSLREQQENGRKDGMVERRTGWMPGSGCWILDLGFSIRTLRASPCLSRVGLPHHLIPRLPGLSEPLSEIRLLEVLFQITIKTRFALHAVLSPANPPSSLFILGSACTSSFWELSPGKLSAIRSLLQNRRVLFENPHQLLEALWPNPLLCQTRL
jgi:hypothetical protein